MKTEPILRIWIDESNILCIKPQTTEFTMIYRSAMNVCWNESEKFLYHRFVGSLSPVEWFQQIIDAVEIEYGYQLYITQETVWQNVDIVTKQLIDAKGYLNQGDK